MYMCVYGSQKHSFVIISKVYFYEFVSYCHHQRFLIADMINICVFTFMNICEWDGCGFMDVHVGFMYG